MNRRQSIGVIVAGIYGSRAWVSSPAASRDIAGKSVTNSPFTGDLVYVHPSEVKPLGWIKEQMYRDLEIGFAGHLGSLCLEASSDIFGAHRNRATVQNRSNHDGINWWNGETEGNWRSGFIQMAYLSRHPAAMREADEYVRHILASQDADGYLGAFAPDVRFRFDGELWTQACLFRGLLAYSELKADKKTLDAVVRAVDCTMRAYRSGEGVWPTKQAHDLMYSDVLERLFVLTGDIRYPAFGLWLYELWSDAYPQNDTSLSALLQPEAKFVQHGVRTYESIRLPLWLATTTQREDIRRAALRALTLLDRYREVSGGEVSGEYIRNLPPDPTSTECEYCAMKEVQATLISALQKTGNAELADRVEQIWFNAAQGARLPDGTAIAYLSPDNRLQCDGIASDGISPEPRNKFSPTHEDVAVCCNPNASNTAALFVRGMWMRDGDDGLVAMLYGPCELRTKVGGTSIHIIQETVYPFEDTVRFTFHSDLPVRLRIMLRVPDWSTHAHVASDSAHIEQRGRYIVVQKLWRAGDSIRLKFDARVELVRSSNGEVAFKYGPLVFAELLPSLKVNKKAYRLRGFEDFYLKASRVEKAGLPANREGDRFGFNLVLLSADGDRLRPFDKPLLALEGEVSAGPSAVPRRVRLVPLGNAPLLRRVTFPIWPTRSGP
jgi:uncharacterized protein